MTLNITSIILISTLSILAMLLIALPLYVIYRQNRQTIDKLINTQLNNIQHHLSLQLSEIKHNLLEKTHQLAQDTHQREVQHLTTLQHNLQETITNYEKNLSSHVEKFTNNAELRLGSISAKVAEQLNTGFQQTNQTFTDIVKRLAVIDNTQHKLTSLSENIVSLQSLLADKRSRGAFGEVQLKNLITNMLPTNNVSFQHTLSNDTRCDCIIYLPEPNGNLVIDAKFPLESYYAWIKPDISEVELTLALRQFRQDVKKHIQDIANKYIIANETADGAIMFIPAEAIFAEIHSNLPELVIYAQEKRVWLASPTTMMAILTTVSAVLKDHATKEHIHVIQQHIKVLAKDFTRFEDRMHKLTRHIDQAQQDAHSVHSSAKKISSRFNKIEQAELLAEPPPSLVAEPEVQST